MPTVSVIIPVYNTSKWLDRCLESVRRQRLRDLEILCVDDGSRDDSAERLTALVRQDGRIRVLHQRNKGLSEARNIGLRETSAGLVYFLDSDDFIHEQLLELAVGALEGNPRAAFALVDYLKVAPDACPSEATIVYPEGEPPPTRTMANPLREFLKDNESPDVWRFVYRREALGALRFVPRLRYEDLDFTYRFLRRVATGVWLHAPLHFYVQTPNSLLRHPFTEDDARFYVWILRHLRDDFAEMPRAWRLLRRRLYSRVLKAMWKEVLARQGEGADFEALARETWAQTDGLFRDGVICRRHFTPKWHFRFWWLRLAYGNRLPLGQRLWRAFWKAVAPFTPHRSPLGRIIRTRGCKKPLDEPTLVADVGRAQQIFQDVDPATDVLCLGTSHTMMSIRPASATHLRLWNAGFINGDYRMAFHTYRALRGKWPKRPGQIVLFSDAFWLPSQQSEYTENYIHSVILHVLIGMPYRSTWLTGPSERRVRRLAQTRQPCDCERGYSPIAPIPVVASQAKRVAGHIRRSRYAPTEMVWFERLRAEVEADGRRLVLFRAPLREDYRAALAAGDGAGVWEAGAEAKRDLTVLDYSELAVSPEFWHDADHLNVLGATWFTPILEHDLEPLTHG